MQKQEISVTFHKSDFNDIYLPYINNADRFLVFYGGRGSGKSVFIAQRLLYKCLSQPYFRLLYCRKVARTIRNSQFQLFKDLIERGGLDELFTIKETSMEIDCINGNNMIAGGMDDYEKVKSIQEITDVWMEEATEFTRDDLIQLNLCLRTKKAHNQMVLSFNPISTANWLFESFFVKKEWDATILKTTFLDNRFLPPDYEKEMERLKGMNPNVYKFSALGEWGGTMEGLIYTSWVLCDDIPANCEIIYGLDFGFNHPTAFTKVGIKEQDVYVKQVLYKSGMTNTDLIKYLKTLNIGSTVIYCDAAEPQRIEELHRGGFNVKSADKEKGSVKAGIDRIKAMNLFLTSDSSDLIKEIQNYKWAEDKNGKPLDEPVKFFDDGCDSWRYAIYTHLHKVPNRLRVSFLD